MVSQIIAIVFGLVCLISGVATLMFCYYKNNSCKYCFKNTFPYELTYQKTNTLSLVGKILVILSLVSIAVYMIIFPIHRNELGALTGIATFINVLGILTCVSALVIFVTDMGNIKYHLLANTFLFGLTFILTTAVSVLGFYTLKDFYRTEIDVKKIVCASIAAFLALIQLILLINPKLRNWSKLEEKENENGTMIYLRPKWFVLAYSEWAFILSIYIDAIILFLMFI